MKDFIKRLLTGIVYTVVVAFCVVYSRYTFLALFMLIIILCSHEFYRLINFSGVKKINTFLHGVGGAILFLTVFLYTSGIIGRSIFSLYLFYIICTLIYELYDKHKSSITRLAYIILGQCYIALPFSVLNILAFPDSTANPPAYQWVWVIALFVFLWANDTGAYLIGVRFGEHRLWERISPKKSWEGFFGGLVFTIISAFAFIYFYPQIAWYHWLALSVGVVIFGTYGDLFESLIKRSVEVKDSGRSLPGHGGFLDRFDSLLFAVYAMLFYLQIFC